jgi:hypothetical protein
MILAIGIEEERERNSFMSLPEPQSDEKRGQLGSAAIAFLGLKSKRIVPMTLLHLPTELFVFQCIVNFAGGWTLKRKTVVSVAEKMEGRMAIIPNRSCYMFSLAHSP